MNGVRRSWIFAVAGLTLALAPPAGVLALWLSNAGTAHPVSGSYLLLTLSTGALMAGFGYVLGRQIERFAELSLSDALTGLPNARAFDEELEAELARAERYRQPVSLLLIDVDRLKGINDAGGHAAGDRALREVALAIRDEVRDSDVPARRSGDEFAIVAPATPPAAARALADRVRTRVQRLSSAGAGPEVTVSIGVSGWCPGTRTPDNPDVLVTAADQALYIAKRHGRNNIALGDLAWLAH